MPQECRSIYQIARAMTAFTQEAAAERLAVSVESLRAYETDRRIPPEKIVVAMVEIYQNQWLAYQHMKQHTELAARMLPNINMVDLPSAVLRLQKEVNDFMRWRDRLVEITCDGVIDCDERPEFDQILKELDDINGAILALKYARE